MRNLLFILVIGFAAYGGYSVWNNHREAAAPPRVAETKMEEPAPVLKQEPTPTPVPLPEPPKVVEPEPPIPVTPVKRLAPEGVFYVVQAFSVSTEDGVRGIRAGTPVKLIKDVGATLRVTDGQQEFDARREFLTNDLDIAGQAQGRQIGQQAANAEWQEKQKQLAAGLDQQKAAEAKNSQDSYQKNMALNNLRARHATLNQEAVRIEQTINEIERDAKRGRAWRGFQKIQRRNDQRVCHRTKKRTSCTQRPSAGSSERTRGTEQRD